MKEYFAKYTILCDEPLGTVYHCFLEVSDNKTAAEAWEEFKYRNWNERKQHLVLQDIHLV